MGSGGADKHQSAANNSPREPAGADVGDEDGDLLEKRERGDPWTGDEKTLLRELIASEGTGPASFARLIVLLLTPLPSSLAASLIHRGGGPQGNGRRRPSAWARAGVGTR